MPSLSQAIIDRWQAGRDTLELWAPDLDDIADLMAPMLPRIQRPIEPGQSRTKRQFDSTAMMAGQKLASHLMGNAVNQATEWHTFAMFDEDLQDDQETNAWLSVVNDHQMDVYNASNFYQAMHQAMLTYAYTGTTAMHCGEALQYGRGPRGQVFTPVPHGSYIIQDDADGQVRTLIRALRYTPVQVIQEFGSGAVSREVREQAAMERTMDTPVTLLHACWPREDWTPGSKNNKRMPFASVYMELETQHVIEETGYPEFPFAVARWEKLSDSPWGFGPGHMALPDTRTLNALKQAQLEMMVLWVKPPMKQVHRGVLGSVSFAPLAINVVRRADDLTPMDMSGRPDLIQISQEDLRHSLHDIFFVSGLEAIPSADDPARTAYEIAQRIAINARLMGPAFYRLTKEFLTLLADRSFALEWRAGNIPPPPPQVMEASARHGGRINIVFHGPLAEAAKAPDAQAVLATYVGVGQMAQAKALAAQLPGPNPFDILDDDVSVRAMAQANNLPEDAIRGATQVARLRAMREAAQQQAQQDMQAQQAASTLKDMAPFMQATQQMQQGAVA